MQIFKDLNAMAAETYGLVYQGSKKSLINDLLGVFKEYAPERCIIFDAFGGGGSVSLTAALNGYRCIYNELNVILTKTHRFIAQGKARECIERRKEFKEFYTREMFNALLEFYKANLFNESIDDETAFVTFSLLNCWSYCGFITTYFGNTNPSSMAFYNYYFKKNAERAIEHYEGGAFAFKRYLKENGDKFCFEHLFKELPRLHRFFSICLTLKTHKMWRVYYEPYKRHFDECTFEQLIKVPFSYFGGRGRGRDDGLWLCDRHSYHAYTLLRRYYILPAICTLSHTLEEKLNAPYLDFDFENSSAFTVDFHAGDYADNFWRFYNAENNQNLSRPADETWLLFCDPPYKDTGDNSYAGGRGHDGDGFNFERLVAFWRRVIAETNVPIIYTSYKPLTDDSVCIFEKEKLSNLLSVHNDDSDYRKERVYIFEPQKHLFYPFIKSKAKRAKMQADFEQRNRLAQNWLAKTFTLA